METGTKRFLIIFSAIIMSIVGWAASGLLGAVLGFILTFFIFWLFVIWIRYRNSD